jgi:hypothetical protein
MRNTIKNVTIVVPVLITNCQVSEKPKKGPLTAQTITTTVQIKKALGAPAARETALEAFVKARSNDKMSFPWGQGNANTSHIFKS